MKLKDFSLLGEDEGSYTIGHPAGRSMKISKEGLSPQAQEHIQKLSRGGEIDSKSAQVAPSDRYPGAKLQSPKYADGGEVNSTPIDAKEDLAPPEVTIPLSQRVGNYVGDLAKSTAQDIGGAVSGAYNSLVAPVVSSVAPAVQGFAQGLQGEPATPVASEKSNFTPDVQAPPEANREVANLPPSGEGVPSPSAPAMPNPASALGSEANAIRGGIAAEKRIGEAQANAQKELLEAQKNGLNILAEQKKEDENNNLLRQAYESHTINPNRVVDNMSTGKRIVNAISLIMGGIGGALTHTDNPALGIINDAIQKDIEAQQNDQSKAMNVWKMNLEQSQNKMQALLASQNQYLLAVEAKIKQAAGENAGALAAARAAPTLAAINQQINENNFRQAVLKDQSQGQKAGQLSKTDPALLVQRFVPKELQKEAYGEIKAAQITRSIADKLFSAFDQAEKENTVLRRAGGLVGDPASVGVLRQLLATTMPELEGTVREAAMKSLEESLIPRKGDFPESSLTRRKGLENYINSKESAPVVKGSSNGLIDLSKYESTAAYKPAKSPIEFKTQADPSKVEIKNGNPYRFNPQTNSWDPVQ